MKFLVETYDANSLDVITESAGSDSYFSGTFMQGNIVNGNGRIYPIDVLKKATKEYVSTHVSNNRALGELGHPENPNVNLHRASHIIEFLSVVGSNVRGKARLLNTPMGNIARGLMGDGVKLGVSSRGLGSVIEDASGYDVIQEDFVITTAADIVFDPSAPEAFVTSLMENRDWVFDAAKNKWRKIETLKEDIASGHFKNKGERSILKQVLEYIDTL